MSGKLFIASSVVAGSFRHSYLVYDPDGNLVDTPTDQIIFRGGPQNDLSLSDRAFNPGMIKLENGFSVVDDSRDQFIGEETYVDRHYTELTLPADPALDTAEELRDFLAAEIGYMGNGTFDPNGRPITSVPYTGIGGGWNSNSVIASLLASANVSIYENLPLLDADDEGPELERMTPDDFTRINDLFVAGSDADDVYVLDDKVSSVTDFGTGATTIKIDSGVLGGNTDPATSLTLISDTNVSEDKVELLSASLADVHVVRTNNDFWIFLPGDKVPSVVLKGQFTGNAFNKLQIGSNPVPHSLVSTGIPEGILLRPKADGTFVAFEAGTYKPLETWTSTSEISITWNHAALFTYEFVEEKVTFASGLEIDELEIDPGFVLEAPGEAETPIEAALDYLEQLGIEMTAQELADAEYDYASPTGTPYTHTGTVDQTSSSSADYHFNNPPGPNATITGPAQVTIQTGVDGLGNPVYGQVTPDTITLYASGDLSRNTISNVNVLDVDGSVQLTAAQFAQFDEITGAGLSGPAFAILAATGGTFDASLESFGAPLGSLTANSWEGTTLKGNNDDGQILIASLLGDDTLIAGGGNDTMLVAGGGKNTLTGSSAGGTTFVVANGLAPGSTLTGSSSGNVLEASGDISGATISGIQTLEASGFTITADQFDNFTAIEGSGTLYAATGGTYDWSGKNATFWDAYALSAGGTTLVANAASGIVTLHASATGNDTLSAPAASHSRIFDAANSTGDITFIAGDGDHNIIYTGYGVSTITLGDGDMNEVIANNGLASGSSITSDNDTTSLLTANGDISGATISGIDRLETETGVILNATQLAGFDALTVWSDQTIIAASAGTYSLAGKGLAGTGGIVTLIGSSGADTLTGSGFADLLYGGADADTVNGGGGDDILAGGDGADTITGGNGMDIISGDAGNDTLVISSGEVLSGEIIDGGDGTDRLTVSNNNMNPSAMAVSNMEELYLNSGVTALTLSASQLDDFETITHQNGGSQAFSITAAAAGTYSLSGKTITGILTLNGSSGADILTGTAGNDILCGKAGADTINAGDGNDNILINSGEVTSGDSIDGGNGTDRLTVGNNSMNPSAMTVANMEELYLNSGVTAITLSASQVADFETITQATSSAFTITAAAAGTYSLAGKTLTGAATLSGSSGNDTLTGSSNADTINGNNGDDIIEGGAGNDTLNGGGNTDTLTYATAGSAVTVDISNGSAQNTGGAGTDTISNFENLTGSAYNDMLTGTSSANILLGGDGNDGITGGDGADTLDGGVGTNTLTGGTGNDIYKLERTYGGSDIVENDSTGGNTDLLQLGSDIAIDQMWFRQSGNDLLVNVIGTDAQMTIKDWYLGSDYQVEEIKTAGGADTLSNSNVQNLVNAMASLTLPETTTLSPEYHTELDAVIAANWA